MGLNSVGVPHQFKSRIGTWLYQTFKECRVAKSPVRKYLMVYRSSLTGQFHRGS